MNQVLDGAERALSGRGVAPPAIRARLDALRALALAHTGRDQDAAALALGLVQTGAREPAAALALAHLALKTGRVDAALQFLDQAIAWSPESPAAWRALSRALRAKGDLVNADRAAAQALALRPVVRAAQ
jgi:predicted Zn-dependent protease